MARCGKNKNQKIAGAFPNQSNPNNSSSQNTTSNNAYNLNNALAALEMYKKMNQSITQILGIDVVIFRSIPQDRSKDVIFQEYTLSNVEDCPYNIKVVVPSGQMPDSKFNFDLMGLEYEVPFEIQIDINYWQSIVGENTAPQRGDIIYIPMNNRLYEIQSMYVLRGFMDQETTFKCNLSKYIPNKARRESPNLAATVDNYTVSETELFGEEIKDRIEDATDNKQEFIVKKFSRFQSCIYKFFVELSILIDSAYLEINAFIKSIYRMKISHNFMLEWITAEEAERNKNVKLKDYYQSMIVSPIIGILFLFSSNPIFWILGTMWIISPWIMHKIGENTEKIGNVKEEDKKFLLQEAEKTWQFFKDTNVNSLPSDNFQADRKKKIAEITSSTNIGLYLLAIIAAYDLKFENLESTLSRLEEIIDTLENLPKWNGHLYNWYNIYSKEPAKPLYVSSVDSGNFVGYLYTVKQFLLNKNVQRYDLAKRINILINNTDFTRLYNPKMGLFSIV